MKISKGPHEGGLAGAGNRPRPPGPGRGPPPAGDWTTAVERTMAWYRAQQGGADARACAWRPGCLGGHRECPLCLHPIAPCTVWCACSASPAGCAWPVRAHVLRRRTGRCGLDAAHRPDQPHSLTRQRGSVRGLHYQRPPHAEMKLVSCLAARCGTWPVDLRAGSPTFCNGTPSFRRRATPARLLLIPPGFAHGFQALTEDAELLYLHLRRLRARRRAGPNPAGSRLALPGRCPWAKCPSATAAMRC